MYQHTMIIGHVGHEPNFRYTPQGTAVCDFSVATSRKTGKGEARKEYTTWFNITVWRELADVAAHYVHKGMLIMCEGTITCSAYVGKNGQPQARLEMTCNQFKFLSSKQDDEQPPAAAETEPAAAETGPTAPDDTPTGEFPF
jgi:single-strand DNA-binding protein